MIISVLSFSHKKEKRTSDMTPGRVLYFNAFFKFKISKLWIIILTFQPVKYKTITDIFLTVLLCFL